MSDAASTYAIRGASAGEASPSTHTPRGAEVRVATELHGDEIRDLQTALERALGEPLGLQVVLDPRIIGGVWVRVGDTVFDGSLRGQIEALRHHLTAQCRVMLSASESPDSAAPPFAGQQALRP